MNPVNTIEHGSNGNGGSAGPVPRERIAARAYELYLQRGAGDGRATEDWLEAEREIAQSERRVRWMRVGWLPAAS